MDDLAKLVEFRIDFEGQRLAQDIYRVAGVVITILSFIVGYATQSMLACVSMFGGCGALLLVGLTVPWPALNAHPVQWLPEVQSKDSAKKNQ